MELIEVVNGKKEVKIINHNTNKRDAVQRKGTLLYAQEKTKI